VKPKLTPAQHVELGRLLKQARRNLLRAAEIARAYPTISAQLFDAANNLTMPRSYLEQRLMEEGMGRDDARDCYFGQLAESEVEDA
jgi:hypothetical protein